MEKTKSFQDLIVWQKSHRQVLSVYKLSSKFPKEETYGLTSQIRRASYSIPMNIVEGYKKRGIKDKANYMNTAEASLDELKYQLILSRDLGYINDEEYLKEWNDSEEVAKMLNAYRKAILKSKHSER